MSIDFKRIIFYLNFIIRALQTTDSWQHINPCDVLLVRGDSDCGYRYDGKAYAQLIDSFGELCINHGLSVSSVAIQNPRFIGDLAQFSPVCFDRSLMRIIKIGKIIEMIHGYKIGKEWIEFHRTDLWCQILKKARPKCIIGIQPDEFLCRAGKLQQIPVYDLQHGIITNEDPYYKEFYRMETPAENLPVGFLCWDDQGADPILKWAPDKGIRVLIVGNPWFMRFARTQPGDELVNKASVKENLIGDNRPCILVSLQYKISEFAPGQIYNGVMVDSLEKVILNTGELFTWIVRVHPVQLSGIESKETFDYLTTTFGIERTRMWLASSLIPLPVVLKKADLHITFSSAVVVEAAWMGIRSGLLNKNIGQDGISEDWFSYERNRGMAEVIPQNPDIIKQWIIDTLAKGRGESTLKDTRQNLDAFIDDIAGMKS